MEETKNAEKTAATFTAIRSEEERRSPKQRKHDDKEVVDRISQLPDCILHSILSLLTLKESAVTTILSKRWRNVFTSLPELVFDEFSFCFFPSESFLQWENNDDFDCWLGNVFNILDSRSEPVKRCTINCCFLSEYKNDFNALIDCLCNVGIEDFTFVNGADRYTVPSSLFSCCELTNLNLQLCNLRVPSKFNGLRSLHSLILLGCIVHDGDLERLFSCCRSVRRLVVENCYELRNIVVNAHDLRMLEISSQVPLAISIAKAPRLDSVTLRFDFSTTQLFRMFIVKEPDEIDNEWVGDIDDYDYSGKGEFCRLLRLLKKLGNIENLSLYLNSTYLKILRKQGVPVPKVLPSECRLLKLKKLTMKWQSDKPYMASMVPCLLNSCPILEELVIRHNFEEEYGYQKVELGDYWDKQMPSNFISNRLATVTLYLVSRSSKYWRNFTKFLLNSARSLKKVVINFEHEDKEPTAFEEFQKELLILQTAFPSTLLKLIPSRT